MQAKKKKKFVISVNEMSKNSPDNQNLQATSEKSRICLENVMLKLKFNELLRKE